jgi:hypothetical protein
MRALGIVLLIFNLLLTAVIGVYLAPQSWAKRQEMNASVAKAYLVKIGLPYEAAKYDGNASTQPISFPTTGGHVVEAVSTDLLKGYFTGADGEPVNSQKEELEKAYGKIQGDLNAMGGPAEVLNLLAGSYAQGRYVPGILALMASTYEQRSEVRGLVPTPGSKPDARVIQDNANKAKEILKQRYEETVAAKSDLEKRDKLAHFLAYLNPQSNTWQKRVILVVGMKQYAKMLGDQTVAYDEIARRVSRAIELDQEFYVQEYERLKKLAIDRAQLRNMQKDVENDLSQNKNDDDTATKARIEQKAKRVQELDTIRTAVKAQLDANAALEKKLQETQRAVGQKFDEILAQEAKLEAAEKTAGSKGGR